MSEFEMEKLPDEVILNVLSYVKIKDLILCGQVSKRIRVISQDESLWKKINLYNKKVPADFVEMVINRGCKYLSLYQIKMIGKFKCLNEKSQLRYLKLSCRLLSDATLEGREEILASCHHLQKLSVQALNITSNMAISICFQNARSLNFLDFYRCTGLDLQSIRLIVENCLELEYANFAFTDLDEDSVKCLANNLTPKIVKLDLSFQSCLDDVNLGTLVKRCNKINNLIVKNTLITNYGLNEIIKNLNNSLEELDVSATLVNDSGLLELRNMPKLRSLMHNSIYLFLTDEEVENLTEQLPILSINNSLTRQYSDRIGNQNGIWEINSKEIELFQNVTFHSLSASLY